MSEGKWIKYSDSEVNCFHPVCEDALNSALSQLSWGNRYEVIHHKMTGSLEMDFVIVNKTDKRVFCVIEVKRRPNDIGSTRYQYQAMSYVQKNGQSKSETPFYILTNLETMFLFRFDKDRMDPVQQILKPGHIDVAKFNEETKDSFISKLSKRLIPILDDFHNNIYEYDLSLANFRDFLQTIQTNTKEWNTHLAFLIYAYLCKYLPLNGAGYSLKDYRYFHGKTEPLCVEGLKTGYTEIYHYNLSKFLESIGINESLMVEMSKYGESNSPPNNIPEVIFNVVSDINSRGNGEVQTDLELTRLVAALVKSSIKAPIKHICDPAAGSGNMLVGAIEMLQLKPNQIIANDIQEKFVTPLSLNIGLQFPAILSGQCHPTITNTSLVKIDPTYFNDVDVIVMNPPFVSGVKDPFEKRNFFSRIYTVSGKNAITEVGQVGLEAPFLELTSVLVVPDTLMVVVFPQNYLETMSKDAIAVRKMLLNRFGLEAIVKYPSNSIFEDVSESTIVLVGRKGNNSESVKFINSLTNVGEINLDEFITNYKSYDDHPREELAPGVSINSVPRSTMVEEIEIGWKYSKLILDAKQLLLPIVNSKSFIRIIDSKLPVGRGHGGTNGGSDLIFISSKKPEFAQREIMGIPLRPAMRNAKYNSLCVNLGDSGFVDIGESEDEVVEEYVNDFLSGQPAKTGTQKKSEKTLDDLIAILETERQASGVPANSILIPRGTRQIGSAYYTNYYTYVSTNFVYVCASSLEDAKIISSWMSTIFYQIECEIYSNNRDGMRKLEKDSLSLTHIPLTKALSAESKQKILNVIDAGIEFTDVNDPIIRDIDRVWATIIEPDNADTLLVEARETLRCLANERQGNL